VQATLATAQRLLDRAKTLPLKNFGEMQAGRHRAEARRNALSIWLRRQVAQADSAGKTDLRPIEALQAARRG
jgi:hypothetical protein